jgi:hypothetical protein
MINIVKNISNLQSIIKILSLITISSFLHTIKGIIYIKDGIDWRIVLIEILYVIILILIIRVVTYRESKCYTIKRD